MKWNDIFLIFFALPALDCPCACAFLKTMYECWNCPHCSQAPGLSLGEIGALVWPTAPDTYSIKNFLQAGIIQDPQAPAAEFCLIAMLQASQGPIG